jgi:hypothetical protein
MSSGQRFVAVRSGRLSSTLEHDKAVEMQAILGTTVMPEEGLEPPTRGL